MPLIREVQKQDLDDCVALEARSYPPGVGATRDRIGARIDKFPKGFLVAEENGEIVGMINGALTNQEDITDEDLKTMVKHIPAGMNAVIFSVVVDESHRRQGIASSLLDEFILRMKNLKRKKILLFCEKELLPLYEKSGFKYFGPSASTHGGIQWHDMELTP